MIARGPGETLQINWSFVGMKPFRRETADILTKRVGDCHPWFTAVAGGGDLHSIQLYATAPIGGVLHLSRTDSLDPDLAALSAALEAPSILAEDSVTDKNIPGNILLRLETYRTSKMTDFRTYERAFRADGNGTIIGEWVLEEDIEMQTRDILDIWRGHHEPWLQNIGALSFESFIEQPERSSHRKMAAVAALRHFGISPL
jgi:hypothetical protein